MEADLEADLESYNNLVVWVLETLSPTYIIESTVSLRC
jgi:hypothetical protein